MSTNNRGRANPNRPRVALGLLTPAPAASIVGAGTLGGSMGETLTFSRTGAKYVETGAAQAYNYISQSSNLAGGTWHPRGTATVEANALIAPDGTMTGCQLTGVGAAGTNDFYTFAGSTVPAGPIALSFWIYPITGSTLGVQQSTGDPGNWTILLSALTPNTWTRVYAGHPAVIVNTAFSANGSNTDGPLFYTGSGPRAFGLWGVQLEAASSVGPYIPTSGSPAASSKAAVVSIASGAPAVGPNGLLIETSHTNSSPNSQDFSQSSWTKRGTTVTSMVGPDGVSAPCQIAGLFNGGSGDVYNSFTTVAGANALSFWVCRLAGSAATLHVQDSASASGNWNVNVGSLAPNTWTRVYAGHPAVTVLSPISGFSGLLFSDPVDGPSTLGLWGVQLEAGSLAHSYVPTTSAAATAGADAAALPSTALPLAAGSVEVDFTPLWSTNANTPVLVESRTGSGGVGICIDITSGNGLRFQVGGTTQCTAAISPSPGVTMRIRMVWGPGGTYGYVNNALVASNLAAPSISSHAATLKLGQDYTGGGALNGYLSNLQIRAS